MAESQLQTEFMSPKEVAVRLGISERSVREKVYQGVWLHLRFDKRTVRFSEENLDEIISMAYRSGSLTPQPVVEMDEGAALAMLLQGRKTG
ncbi:excisionase family DNA binding protein [Arthrobacter sp. CAN_A212]|uniref:helix-turn-helix domain-containing protein n=1 Tax=unclassified Arthrobacter TaxID=235627 RepID=UPI0018C98304|nr:helix-turn-helix domain-containing protein [Arthrobacter sp. CAN_C5]MBP2216696.1 excisionase family DNA binding protein [Arthrobacter sp. CAN_C5]